MIQQDAPPLQKYLEGHGDLVSRLIMEKKMKTTTIYHLGFRVMGTK